MKKLIVTYIISFLICIALAYTFHAKLYVDFANASPIAIQSLYLFHIIFTLALVILLSFLMFQEKFKDQIGFFYLASMILKIFLFCIVFKQQIFNDRSFTNEESINLLIPMALALLFEILFLSKILNTIQPIKND